MIGLSTTAAWGSAELGNYLLSYSINSHRTERPETKERAANSLVLGIAPDHNDLDHLDSLTNPAYSIIHLFCGELADDWGPRLASASEILAKGKLPMLSMYPVRSNRSADFSMATMDTQQELLIEKAKMMGAIIGPLLVRFAYEFNGSWFPHGTAANTPDDFITGWQYFVSTVREYSPNSLFVFSPNVSIGANAIEPYYPGDEWVDVIGLDGYEKHNEFWLDIKHYINPNMSFDAIFGPDLARLEKLKKPIIISEFGTARSNGSGWMLQGLNALTNWPNVRALVLFAWDQRKRSIFDEADWANKSVLDSLEAYHHNEFVAKPTSTQDILDVILKE